MDKDKINYFSMGLIIDFIDFEDGEDYWRCQCNVLSPNDKGVKCVAHYPTKEEAINDVLMQVGVYLKVYK